MGSYSYAPFPYRRPAELDGAAPHRRPVVVVGAGPVGLTLALDLATRGVPVVVLDDNDVVSVGSRAICWAKRTLEIWDRLGIGARVVDKGVTWQVGRVFHGDRELYSFDLLPEAGHKMPAFVNLQQYYVEQYLVERAADFPGLVDLRWKNTLTGLRQDGSGVTLEVSTPDGPYRLEADHVVAADGARSPVRTRMGLAFAGQVFEERFLIADVRMRAAFPPERLFWFEPTFHPGQSALLHKQPDDVYRIDFQLGPEADFEAERQPERVIPRVRAIVGETPFELDWCSVYAFRCARIERFVHGRVIFAGDSAHVVSPFGARGGNGGVQDADNLGWKLALVAGGRAPASLLDSYDRERGHAADENIAQSSRTTTFMTPKTRAERLLRDGVLALAPDLPFARTLLNAGRLSCPCSLAGMDLQTPAPDAGGLEPGTACPDAPLLGPDGREVWLLDSLGSGFTLLVFTEGGTAGPDLSGLDGPAPQPDLLLIAAPPAVQPPHAEGGYRSGGVLVDREGLAASRYGAAPGAVILVRPDQHVAARFPAFDRDAIAAALRRACGQVPGSARLAA